MHTRIIDRSATFAKSSAFKALLAAGLAATMVCSPAGQSAWAASGDQASVLVSPVPSISGPKRTIAVGSIDITGTYAGGTSTEAGGAIAAMLSTALEESGNFVVVERNALSSVLTEQSLAQQGVTSGSAAPLPGKVIPASYIVVGSITEVTAPSQGNGGGISFGRRNLFNIGAASGKVRIDLRIVDTRTGGLVKAFSVQRSLTSVNLGFSGRIGRMPVATNQFFNSSLGGATRKALSEAVGIISDSLGRIPWQGQVVEAADGMVYVNAGSEAGLVPGSRMAVRRIGRTFTDPATGAVLGHQVIEIGEVTISVVDAKMSYGSFNGMENPARGDMIQPL
ncbi:MAG: CsgG/HfaB family protein [Novosphingobium sp.]